MRDFEDLFPLDTGPGFVPQDPQDDFLPEPSIHEELVRLWLMRLIAAPVRPLDFRSSEKEVKAKCLRKARAFVQIPVTETPTPRKKAPAAEEDSWEWLTRQVQHRLKTEDPGGLLPLPSNPYLNSLKQLSARMGLDPIEREILVWAYLVRIEEALWFIASGLSRYRRLELAEQLERVLGVEPGDVGARIQPGSPLIRTGVIEPDYLSGGWVTWLGLSDQLAEGLYFPGEDPMAFFKNDLEFAPKAMLSLEDYPHLDSEISCLSSYLTQAMRQRQSGVNILIYGPPGTGKTQLVRAIAESIGKRLCEVVVSTPAGAPKSPLARLNAFATGQLILNCTQEALILFDEMESSFSIHGLDSDEKLRGMKGWLNRTLEMNPVPTLWITNNQNLLDSAFIRRFQVCIEVGVPPRSVRRRILKAHLDDLSVKDQLLDALAEQRQITPALCASAAQVVRLLCQAKPDADPGDLFTNLVQGHLAALGHGKLNLPSTNNGIDYRLEGVQADADLAEIVNSLKESNSARLCLYGPPGTGKTAFGKYLASALGQPLLVKRASDLQSKWLGEAEQNIARMFSEAARENAILLLDEADSFLRDRRWAGQNWEVSQVNEMLTQIESFEGIFVATTNLMDSLDPAAMRRFDLKIRFHYLKPEQVWTLFRETCTHLGLETGRQEGDSFRQLNRLTPGDFANIFRQHRLRQIHSSEDLLGRLRAECAIKKDGGHQAIGF